MNLRTPANSMWKSMFFQKEREPSRSKCGENKVARRAAESGLRNKGRREARKENEMLTIQPCSRSACGDARRLCLFRTNQSTMLEQHTNK